MILKIPYYEFPNIDTVILGNYSLISLPNMKGGYGIHLPSLLIWGPRTAALKIWTENYSV